jgi:hypothetical protein
MSGPAQATAEVPVTREDDSRESRFYTYPPTGELLDRVSTIISGTDSKPWLKDWAAGSAAAWAVDNMALLQAVMREEGRDAAVKLAAGESERLRGVKRDAGTYVQDVQEALILWAASPGRTGTDIAIPLLPEHLEGATYDLGGGRSKPLRDVVDDMVDGFVNWVSAMSPEFLATEMTIYNQPLGYGGTLDMIVTLAGYAISYGTGPKGADEIVASPGSVLVVCIDTKTGRDPEGTWKEQLAPYRRARQCQPSKTDGLYPMLPTDCGAVLHLRPDYPDGWMLMLVSSSEDEAAWERFTKAASIYRERQKVKAKPGTSIRALRPDGTMPGYRLCDLAGEGYGRALAPLRKALGADAELSAVAEFTAAELLSSKGKGVKGVGPKLIDVIREMLADHHLALKGEEPRTYPPNAKAA